MRPAHRTAGNQGRAAAVKAIVRRRRRSAVILLVLAAGCGPSSDIETSPSPSPAPSTSGPSTAHGRVIAEPDEIAFRYTESGGIAGETAVDLVVYGDGRGTVTSFDGEPEPITVSLDELNAVLVELERAGVHDIDPGDHPEVSIADGFGLDLTVHSTNGTSSLSAYGLFEAPEQFAAGWYDLFEAGRRAATDLQDRRN